jgi:Protein of unknown function (DUF2961)/HEAT repeats
MSAQTIPGAFAPLAVALALFVSFVPTHRLFAQAATTGAPDTFDVARLKSYSAARVSSSNRFVDSNDDSKRILPGETLVLADLKGAGMITHVWLTVADSEFAWPRLLRLRVYYDGHKTPSVDAPLGDFFGVGHGSERNLESNMIRDSSQGRARNSYWPMPYRKSCRMTVTNEGTRLVAMFYYHVDYRRYASLPNDVGYFHAYYRQERPARMGQNYAFLDIKGEGHYVGTVMSVVQTQVSWFGEGDDLFYIDGAKNPQILGTGSEDYFNDAWGLRDSTGPWTGTPITEGEKMGSRLSAYRWHIPDPIPFKTSLWAGIEHAGWTANPDGSVRSGFEQRPDFFSSVAFWYQKGVNESLPEPPYGTDRLPFGNATQLTVEDSIRDVTSEHGKARVLKEVDWEKDLLYFEAEGPGAKVGIPIDIAEPGHYELIGLLAQGPNYGDYTAFLDGEPMNLDKRQPSTSEVPLPGPDVVYGYLPELYVARDWSLGTANLTKGRHILTLVCAGKDSHSSGYALGINDVVLEKMPDMSPAAPKYDEPTPGRATTGVVYRGQPLEYYLSGFKSATGSTRIRYAESIGAFGIDGAPAASALRTAFADPDPAVRRAAALALEEVGTTGADLPALIKLLEDSDPGIRVASALALKSSGENAAPAVQPLIKTVDDPVLTVRLAAINALGAIGPSASAAAPALAAVVDDRSQTRFMVRSSMLALGKMGPGAQAALPSLRRLAQERPDSTAGDTILLIEGKQPATYF